VIQGIPAGTAASGDRRFFSDGAELLKFLIQPRPRQNFARFGKCGSPKELRSQSSYKETERLSLGCLPRIQHQ
jgi:hypothetical protein